MKKYLLTNRPLIIGWLLGVAAFLFIYLPAWHNPFFQDDFLLLKLTHPQNIHSWSDFLAPISKNFHYRPLAFNVYYYVLQQGLGLNWFGFHLVNSIWLLATAGLVWLILHQLTDSPAWSLIGAILYLISPIHYMTQFWTATFNNTQGVSLLLLSFYWYLRFDRTHQHRYLLAAMGLFGAALLTNEGTIVLPGLIGVYLLFLAKRPWQYLLSQAFLWGGIALSYLLIRLATIGLPAGPAYGLSFSLEIFSTLKWYVFRTIGLPEGIRFIDSRSGLYLLSSLSLGVIAKIYLSNKSKIPWKYLAFGLSWFIIGGLPFYALPNHLSAYYLETAYVGLVLIYVVIFKVASQKILAMTFVILSFFISLMSVRGMQATHWVNWRGDLARVYIEQISSQCDSAHSTVTIKTVDGLVDEAAIVLNRSAAAQVLCDDLTLETTFTP